MTRRRSSRSRRSRRSSTLHLQGVERVLAVFGAILYLVGLFGGLQLLAMPASTAILLLALGGGLLLALTLALIF
ncbi:MAG: hypothetical protein ACLFU8_11160 [Anaerolineales bacterium]